MATVTQLEYIVAVDRFRHFARAAEHCHVSQPSLSMQIQKVEDEIGGPIFDRTKKPILPTDQGARFIEQAKVVLREHRRLIEAAKTGLAEVSGHFRLGVIPTLAPYLLPLFLDDFAKRYPKVSVHIEELNTETIVGELSNDRLDGGLLATPLSETRLKEEALFYEPFFVYLPPDHPLTKKKYIAEDDLDGSEMWLLEDGHCLRNQVVRVCSLSKGKDVYKNIHFEGGNLETLRYLIQQGRGYTVVPYLFATHLGGTERARCIRPFHDPVPTREISLVYHRDQWKAPILRAIAECVRKHVPPELLERGDRKSQAVVKVS